jgi:hypothetical protein
LEAAHHLSLNMDNRRSCRTANDLAIEWVAQILSFLSIAQRFICKSVSKKWLLAANQSLADQDEVTFTFSKLPDGSDKTNVLSLTGIAPCPAEELRGRSFIEYWARQQPELLTIHWHASCMAISLSCFKNLTKVTIIGKISAAVAVYHPFLPPVAEDNNKHKEYIMSSTVETILKSVILYNSRTLVRLCIENFDLPQDDLVPVMYPRLRELSCNHLSRLHSSSFRCLTKLTVRCETWLFNGPAETLQELWIKDGISVVRKYLLFVISRLSNLKILRLDGDVNVSKNENDSPTDDDIGIDEFCCHMFQDFTKLEELCLSLYFSGIPGTGRIFIPKLVQNNPNLRKICIHSHTVGGNVNCVNAKSLQFLAGLEHLQGICFNYGGNDPTGDLITFLRGRCRLSLQRASLCVWDQQLPPFDIQLIEREAQLMREETGLAYTVATRSHHSSSSGITITRSDAGEETNYP